MVSRKMGKWSVIAMCTMKSHTLKAMEAAGNTNEVGKGDDDKCQLTLHLGKMTGSDKDDSS
jgi:hypothetical protein